jgi:hypothetical protein
VLKGEFRMSEDQAYRVMMTAPWDCDAKPVRGFEIDEQLDLRDLLHRQISGLVALENSSHVVPDQTVVFRFTPAVADQSAGSDELTKFVDRGQRMLKG